MKLVLSRLVIIAAIVASLVANVALIQVLQHYYAETKRLAAQPLHTQQYERQNDQLMEQTSNPLVVLFGDSRIAQWDPLPDLQGAEIVSRGIGGETTAQMIYRFQDDVIGLSPDTVIIQAGINDLVAASLTPALSDDLERRTVANLVSMTAQARDAGIRVILLDIFPPARPSLLRRFFWSDTLPELVERANAELATLHAPPDISVVLSQDTLQEDGEWRESVIADTLHLRPNGYRLLNERICSLLLYC
jgi:lysophospholipase L1-like esterase